MSYIYANTFICNTASNTNFRAYGSAISNTFAKSGWLQANDAGQINWTTVVANGTSGSVMGTEIWHMGDALQNTAPVYVRIDYCTLVGVNYPGFNISVGKGTDGSLNLLALASSVLTQRVTGASAVMTPAYMSGDPNRISIGLFSGILSEQGILINIERTHSANGSDTADGVLAMITGTSTSQQYWNAVTGPGPLETTYGAFVPTGGAAAGTGNAFHIYPNYFDNNAVYLNPAKYFLLVVPNHVALAVPFTVTHYGAPHTYLPVALQGSFRGNGGGTGEPAPGTMYSLIAWE
jgi:hypothetical protein